MTTDIERELRELFRDKAGEAPISTLGTSGAAPQQVLRRGRRHQAGTVVGSALVAALLAVGSFAGLRSVLRDSDGFQPGQEYEVFERTATIEAFTITSPSDWFLVNQWPRSIRSPFAAGDLCPEGNPTQEVDCMAPADPMELDPSLGLPMVQLTNEDIGLASTACGQKLGTDTATLFLALDHERDKANVYPPYLADPGERALPPQTDGPCGLGRYASFSVGGQPFFAWIGLGDAVSDDDRSVVMSAFESMVVDDSWKPVPPAETTPAYVLAGGTADTGKDWRLELRPGKLNVWLTLEGIEPGGGMDGWVVPERPIEPCCQGQDGYWPVAFGAIRMEATGVELRPADGSPAIQGTIVPLPPTLPYDFDLFFIARTAGLNGEVIALGLEGDGSASPPPAAAPRGEVVDLSGSLLGHDWGARFTGAFADESACIHVSVDRGTDRPPICMQEIGTSLASDDASVHSWVTNELALFAGTVPPEIVELRFTSDDGTQPPSQFRCQMGPSGWTNPDRKVCAIALPPEGSGTLAYLDANGKVVSEEGTGWGSAQATSGNEYPWTNEGGFITARGSFRGAGWRIEVLYYRDGYRLSIDGREVFQGTLREGEPVAFPIFQGDRGLHDALVLLVDGDFAEQVSIASEGTWDGRWLPGSTANGAEARVWVIEVPGAGTGSLLMDGVDRGRVSWP